MAAQLRGGEMQNLLDEVAQLEVQADDLRKKIAVARKSLYEAQLHAAGLVPGETVLIWRDREYLFDSCDMDCHSKPIWPNCHGRCKNGQWSKKLTTLWNNWKIKP
jgi:hypothetical protein